jgi:hypothetical protein
MQFVFFSAVCCLFVITELNDCRTGMMKESNCLVLNCNISCLNNNTTPINPYNNGLNG